MIVVLITVAIALGIGRLFITPRLKIPTWSGSYEAFAHLFVGGLIGAYLVAPCGFYGAMIGCLSVWEIVAFAIQRRRGREEPML